MEQIFTTAFVKEGVLGIVILALGIALMRMFKLYTETQEKRLTDSRDTVKAVMDNTNAIERLAELIRDRLPRAP